MTYFKEKWCFVGNGLFISWTASCKFTHLWKPHFLPIVQSVAQKCCSVISLDVKESQLCQFDVMSSAEGTKVVRVHFEGLCVNELEKEVGREEAPNFSWSFASWQNCEASVLSGWFWMLMPLFHGAWHPILHNLWGMREEMSAKIYGCKCNRYKSV